MTPLARSHCHFRSQHCSYFKAGFSLEAEKNSPCCTMTEPREQLWASRDLENTQRYFTWHSESKNSIILILLRLKPVTFALFKHQLAGSFTECDVSEVAQSLP